MTRLLPGSGRYALAMVLAAGLALAWPAAMAGAHTQLLQGSPGPGQQAGGTVDFLDLIFVDPVTDVSLVLQDPNGDLVGGEMVVSDGQIIRYEMPALTVPGRYIVRYTMISFDGDSTESAYFFTYEPEATQPARLGDAELPPAEGNGTTILVAAVSVVVGIGLIGLVLLFLSRLERNRAEGQEQSSARS